MRFAQKEDGTFVFAEELIDENGHKLPINQKYVCSQCKRPVYFKNGKDTRPHFAHYARSVKDHDKVNESDIHLKQKTVIYNHLIDLDIECELEVLIENQLRRADIYIPYQTNISHNLTIEVQYTKISSEDVYRREIDYQRVNCRVLWLLGYQSSYQKIFDKNNIFPVSKTLNAIRPFLRYSYEYGLYLPFWHERLSKVILLTLNLYGQAQRQICLSIERYISYFNEHYIYEQGDFITHLLFEGEQPIKLSPPKDLNHFMKQVLVKPTSNQKKVLEIIYQRHTYIQDAPVALFTYQARSIFSKVADWAIILVYLSMYHQDDDAKEKMHFGQFVKLLQDQQLIIEHPFFTKEIIVSWLMWLIAHYESS